MAAVIPNKHGEPELKKNQVCIQTYIRHKDPIGMVRRPRVITVRLPSGPPRSPP